MWIPGRQWLIWRDKEDRTQRTLALYQVLETLVNGVEEQEGHLKKVVTGIKMGIERL